MPATLTVGTTLTELEYIEEIFALPDGAERELRFRRDPALKQLLPELYRLDGIPQSPFYHPEGDVLTHTLLAIRHLPPNPDRRLAWGTLFHDLGKAVTTQNIGGRIRSFGHARAGIELVTPILNRLKVPAATQDDIYWLIRNHMFALDWQVESLADLSRRQWRFIRDPRFPLLLELMRADAMAAGTNPEKLHQVDLYRQAWQQASAQPGCNPEP
ncbi:MAG: HD domain-containing protein [Desulfuromonadaceae bacterium]|jgi:hypothetical protein